MKYYVLICTYGLLLCGLVGARSAAAECDEGIMPLVGSEQSQGTSVTGSSPGAGLQGREALNRMAIMYARGRGLPKRPRLALKLFRTLAVEGYAPAMVNLGTIYELGLAGRRDHRLAYAWIRAGLTVGVADQELDATVFKLGMIAARLGTTQTYAAERLATNISEAIAVQCEHWDRRYTEAIFTVTSP
jgi:TPR repeat protein